MISVGEFYSVMTAVVPLYVAMILAYGSVRWWKILTPDQCGGINRFVAIFAVPLLSFQIISGNNPYEMSGRFILADSLQKIAVLGVVGIWARYSRWGSLDWMITLFMLATLPNTLVMGVPLLTAMYGNGPARLVVQAVVLQCILWYTFLLFLFEYRAAKLLISQKFPTSAKSIASVKVDPEIVSLDYREGLTAEAHFREDGKICVQFKKSPTPSNLTPIGTPHPSDLSNVEIYSIQSSSDRTEYFNKIVSDSLQSSNAHTPQEATSPLVHITPNVEDKFRHLVCSRTFSNNAVQIVSNTESDSKELQMFVWSAGTSPRSPGVVPPKTTDDKEEKSSTGKDGDDPGMPSTAVMTKLILDMVWRKLIRNPNTYSSLIGLVWALISFRWRLQMPKIIERSIRILSDAGLGMAMFSLGLFMALQPKLLACGTSMTIIGMAIRFITSPAVMSATSIAAGLRNVELKAAIIQAALPQGIVPFVFAKEYNVHPDILSTAVIFGMLVSLPITLVYYILLGL